MNKVRIAIIGMGPRGLSILERLNAIYKISDQNLKFELHLIDPRVYGQGIHTSEQSDHLLVNTIACQITMFSDDSVTDAGPIIPGLSILEWARQHGYRELNNKFLYLGNHICNEINANAYLPRRMLGEYLSWVYREQINQLHPNIKIIRHQQLAYNIDSMDDGQQIITLANGYTFHADKVFITTGHGENTPSPQDLMYLKFVQEVAKTNHKADFIRNITNTYSLHHISSEAVVAIEGIGLTTYDLISQLTEGRSGKFIKNTDGTLKYLPSGEEPHILVYSRYGLPYASRGINQKGAHGQYQARFFTTNAIDKLRIANQQNRGNGQLDFGQELLPILLKEMCYVYRCTIDKKWYDIEAYVPTSDDFTKIEQIFFGKLPSLQNYEAFKEYAINYLQTDIEDALKGNIDGAIKATTDIIRDIRDCLRYAVDYAGLTPTSHKIFIEQYCPIMNRIAVGPPVIRSQQLLALLNAGVIEFACGPKGRVELNYQTSRFNIISEFSDGSYTSSADILIKARTDTFYPALDKSPFIANLLKNGTIQPFFNGDYHPSGIAISHHHHPINKNGDEVKALWALGNIVEGANFYTYVLPRPGVNSRAIRDAGKCVLELFEQLETHEVVAASKVKNSQELIETL